MPAGDSRLVSRALPLVDAPDAFPAAEGIQAMPRTQPWVEHGRVRGREREREARAETGERG